jgi:hypothetical protein
MNQVHPLREELEDLASHLEIKIISRAKINRDRFDLLLLLSQVTMNRAVFETEHAHVEAQTDKLKHIVRSDLLETTPGVRETNRHAVQAVAQGLNE